MSAPEGALSADSDGLPEGPGRRLHPWSLAFGFFSKLRGMAGLALPLLVGSFSERFSGYALYGIGVAVALTLVSTIAHVWWFRYWVTEHQLVIRSGWLEKTVRRVPWSRIENLTVKRGLFHRWLGVAEVAIESGGGEQADAALQVLSRREALAMSSAIGERRQAAIGGAPDAAIEDVRVHTRTLVKLDGTELLRAGLISNRGFLALAAAIAVASQLDDVLPLKDWLSVLSRQVGSAIGLQHGPLFWLILGLLLGMLLLLFMRLLSVSWWLLMYWGFRLSLEGDKLRSDYGALTRIHASATRDRICKLLLSDGIGYRLMGRVAVKVGVAGQHARQSENTALTWVAPVLPPDRINALVQDVFPDCHRAEIDWQPLHPSCRKRLFRLELLWLLLLLPVAFKLGDWTLLLAAIVVVSASWSSRSYRRFSAYAFDGRFLAFRGGIVTRQEWWVPVQQIESVQLKRSPGDRRHGTAKLALDLRCPGPAGMCVIKYLDWGEARELAAQLGQMIDGRSSALETSMGRTIAG